MEEFNARSMRLAISRSIDINSLSQQTMRYILPMSEELFTIVGRFLTAQDVDGASAHLERLLCAANSDRFGSLLESRFTNSPQSVLTHINTFLVTCQKQFDVKAVYLPHNGFVYNNDRWYFDSLAYDQVHDLSLNWEWLCHSNSPNWDIFTLLGLESAQQDFRWYVENDACDQEHWQSVADIAEFLVKVRFVQLVQSALATGSLCVRVPVFVTAYTPEFYCRFDP